MMARKPCAACSQVIEWILSPVSQKPEPRNLDGTPHFDTCPMAYLYRPPEPGDEDAEQGKPGTEDYSPGRKAIDLWSVVNDEQLREMQRESLRVEAATSGVRACRDNPRDARHGDKWCRRCWHARPANYECEAGVFYPPVRYARGEGGALTILRGEAEVDAYLTKLARDRSAHQDRMETK